MPDLDNASMSNTVKELFLTLQGDGAQPGRAANTQAKIAWCLAHPLWRLSPQAHKITGSP